MSSIAFVCVGNAGRSQMATAYAERERSHRNLRDDVDIVTGGTEPKERVHEEVIDVLAEDDIDIEGRTPRAITPEDVTDVDHIVTMGCSADEFIPPGWEGTHESWELSDPEGAGLDAVRAQRDEIKGRVARLFDSLETA